MKHLNNESVPHSLENIEKLVRKIMEDIDFDTMWQSAQKGLINHYINNDQCFAKDYREKFENTTDNIQEEKENRVNDSNKTFSV